MKDNPLTEHRSSFIMSTDVTTLKMREARLAGCAEYLAKRLIVRDINLTLQRDIPSSVKRKTIRFRIAADVIIVAEDRRIKTRIATCGEGGHAGEIG